MAVEQETPGTEQVVDKATEQETPGTEKQVETPGTGERQTGWIADDWRERIAGQDQKLLEQLKRFSDPAALAKSYKEAQTRISTMKPMPQLPDNPTPEQVATYRKELDVPEKPDQYELTLDDGVIFGKEDEPAIGYMLEVMHEANTPKHIANAVINGYFQMREAEANYFAEQQNAIRLETDDKLHQEWGGNYRQNINTIQNMLSQMPDGVGELLMAARLPDGSTLGNNYNAIKALAQLATEVYPAATVVPGGSSNQMENIDAKLAEFKAMRIKDINGWHKNLDAKKQERDLLDAKQKLQFRGR